MLLRFDKKLQWKEMFKETLFTVKLCSVKLNMAKTYIFS